MFELRILRSLTEMQAVESQWRALESAAGDTLGYFQTYDWCANWVAHFTRPTPHVRTLWQDGVLVGVWPLMVAGGGIGLKRLETLGDPHTQYAGMILSPGVAPEAAAAALLDGIGQEKVDVAVFRPVPANGPLGAVLRKLPQIAGYENAASVLDLSGYASSEDYSAQLGKLQKRNRNRRRNHLARLGELSFEMIWPEHPEFRELVGWAVAMKRDWLKQTQRYSVGFAMAGYDDFMASLPGEILNGACLSVLRAGERVVAVELGFVRNRHYYAYLGGFDWALRDLSPGKVQMEMTVSWLIDQGVRAYDLLGNSADYKQSWSNSDVTLVGHALPLSLKGKLYAQAWLPTVRPALKRAYGAIPEMAQRALWFARGFGLLVLYI